MTQPVSLAVRSFEDLTSVEEPSLYTPAAPIQPGKEQAVAARVEVFWDEAETAAVEIVSPAIFGDPRGAEARAFLCPRLRRGRGGERARRRVARAG